MRFRIEKVHTVLRRGDRYKTIFSTTSFGLLDCPMLDVRVWYKNPEGNWLPGHGVSLRDHEALKLLKCLADVFDYHIEKNKNEAQDKVSDSDYSLF